MGNNEWVRIFGGESVLTVKVIGNRDICQACGPGKKRFLRNLTTGEPINLLPDMFTDLKVTLVEGGPDPALWKGMYPPYLYFSSREGKFRSGNRRIKQGRCSGRVVYKKEALFYFVYEKGGDCRVFPIRDGVRGEDFIVLECALLLLD